MISTGRAALGLVAGYWWYRLSPATGAAVCAQAMQAGARAWPHARHRA